MTASQYAAYQARRDAARQIQPQKAESEPQEAGIGPGEPFTRSSENDLQEKIAQYLRLKGVTFGKSRMDRKTTYTVGWPDFTFVLAGGRAVFLEAKLPGEQPEGEQPEILAALEAAGAFVRVVHSQAEAIAAFQEAESDAKGTK